MSSQPRRIKKSSPETIQAKVLVGYHAWFTCEGDGAPVHQGRHGWSHWIDRPLPQGGHPTFDLFPDVTTYTSSELYPVHEMTLVDGSPARLFSSRNPATVKRHLHWLAEHGIDGVFLQRFAAHCEVDGNWASPLADLTRFRDEITDKVREAAEAEGRVWAIEYDVRGVPMERLPQVILRDWDRLVKERGILNSPSYLRERGRAVIGIRGIGFIDSHHDPMGLIAMVKQLRSITPGGLYIMAGVSSHWRMPNVGDHDANPAFREFYREIDALSPWSVGQFNDEPSADWYASEVIRKDIQEVRSWNEAWDGQKKVDYIPVAFPGYSTSNLRAKSPRNQIPRLSGRFLWRQIYHLQREGARILYIDSLDGYDDATAILPITTLNRLLPVDYHFLALDADGDTNLSPDWYMRVCGMAADVFRGDKQMATDLMPKKELGDYWATRPRYEYDESASSSIEGSSSTQYNPGSSSAAGLSPQSISSFGRQPTLQRSATLEVDGAPAPPPYSLEAEKTAAQPTAPASTPAAPGDRLSQQAEPGPPRRQTPFTTSPTTQTEPLPPHPEGQGPYISGPQPPVLGATTIPSSFPPQASPGEQWPARHDTRPHVSHSDSVHSYYSVSPPTNRPPSQPTSRPPTSNAQRPGSASGMGPPVSPIGHAPPNTYVPQTFSSIPPTHTPTQSYSSNPIPGFSNLSMQTPLHPTSPPPGVPGSTVTSHPPAGFFTPQEASYNRPFSPPTMNPNEGATSTYTAHPGFHTASSSPPPAGFHSYTAQNVGPNPDPRMQTSTPVSPSRHSTLGGPQAAPQHSVGGGYQSPPPQGSPTETPSVPTEGGFVLPGHGPPGQQHYQAGVGGFAPSLGRNPSVKLTDSFTPPPLHPSRTGTVPQAHPTTVPEDPNAQSGQPPVPSLPGQQQPSGYTSTPNTNYSQVGGDPRPFSPQNAPGNVYSGHYAQQTYPPPQVPATSGQTQQVGDVQQNATGQYGSYQSPVAPPTTSPYAHGYQSYSSAGSSYQATTYGAPSGPPSTQLPYQQTAEYPAQGQTYTPTATGTYSYGGSHIPGGGYGIDPTGGYQQQQQQWGQHGAAVQQHQAQPPKPTGPMAASILNPARNALDKYAGEERRKMLEKGIGNAMNTGSKWLNKFSGSK